MNTQATTDATNGIIWLLSNEYRYPTEVDIASLRNALGFPNMNFNGVASFVDTMPNRPAGGDVADTQHEEDRM